MNILFENIDDTIHALGCFASSDSGINSDVFAVVVFTISLNNDRYVILDHWKKTGNVSIDECSKVILSFTQKYNVEYAFTNIVADAIYTNGNLKNVWLYKTLSEFKNRVKWKITEINSLEKMIFLTKSHGNNNKIYFDKQMTTEQREEWNKENKTFVLADCQNKIKIYPLLCAFWHGIIGIESTILYTDEDESFTGCYKVY